MDSISKGKHRAIGWALIVAVMTTVATVQAATKPIGRVMMAQGRIQLIHADGSKVTARGGTYFLAGDTFKTSSSSRAQLRFEDGTLISLRPDSEFKVNDYNYDPKNKNNNRSVFSLVKGGFATVSGWLGKLKPEGYAVRTPVAIVGIRGTHYELVVEDGLSAAVWQGGISIRNEAASLKLGYGAAFNYAHVPAANKPPVGLLKPPPTIHPQAGDLYVAGKEETLEGDPNQEGGDDTSVSSISDDPAEESAPLPSDQASQEDDTLLADTTGTDSLGNPVDPVNDATGTTSPYGTVVPYDLVTNPVDRRAYGVYSGTNGGPLAIGYAPDLSAGGGYIHDPNLFYGGTKGFIVEPGANTTSGAFNTANGDQIDWGKWTGTTIYTDSNDMAFYENPVDPMYWLTIANAGVTMPAFGTATYTLVSVAGTGSGGAINAGTFDTSVDFSTGKLSGSWIFTDGAAAPVNSWDTNFSGSISGSDFQANLASTSSVNGIAAKGVIHGSFAGTDAEAFGAVFDFDATDASVYADGVLVASRATQPFLSAADYTDLASYGRTAFGVTGKGTYQFIGESTDLGSGGSNPVLTNIDPLTTNEDLVARPGLAGVSVTSNYTGSGAANGAVVSWGKWDTTTNPFIVYTDLANDQVNTSVNENLYWLNMVQTATMPTTGIYNYSLNKLEGEGTAGALTSVNFVAQVDFSNALITGSADLTDGGNNWATNYTGVINGSSFSATLDTSSTVNGANIATGTIDGGFSGNDADTVGGMFSFVDSIDPAVYANGVFILDGKNASPVLSASDQADLATANMRGFAVFSGTSTSAPLYGDATDLSTAGANPIIFDSGINTIARADGLTTRNDTGSYAASNGESVKWGNWGTSINVYTDPNDINNITVDNNTMYWLTMNTSNTTMPVTGQFYYAPVAGAQDGIGTGGVITTASMDAMVDFSTGGIKGGLILQDGTYSWNTTYSGAISGAEFDAILETGSTVNGNAAQGALHGGFTGTNADALAGVFNLEQVGAPGIYADGTYVLEQTATQPYLTVIDQVDLNHANRIAMVNFDNTDFNAQLPLMGVSTDLSSANASGNQLLYDATQQTVMRSTGNTTFSFEDSLTEAGGATLSDGVTVATGVDIHWGDWNTEAMLYTDPADESVQSPATMNNGFATWVSMTPTAVMPSTGTATYTLVGGTTSSALSDSGGNGLSIYSTGNASTTWVGEFNANVDFATGGITGVMTLDDNPSNWEVTYDGTITGNTFSATTLGFNAGSATLNTNNAWEINTGGGDNAGVDGFVQGGFSGDNAEAIAGTFHFQNQTGLVSGTAAGTHVIGGAFVMTQ